MTERPRQLFDLRQGIQRFAEAMRNEAPRPVHAPPSSAATPAEEQRAALVSAGTAIGALLGAATAEAFHAIFSDDKPKPSPPDRSNVSQSSNPQPRR